MRSRICCHIRQIPRCTVGPDSLVVRVLLRNDFAVGLKYQFLIRRRNVRSGLASAKAERGSSPRDVDRMLLDGANLEHRKADRVPIPNDQVMEKVVGGFGLPRA